MKPLLYTGLLGAALSLSVTPAFAQEGGHERTERIIIKKEVAAKAKAAKAKAAKHQHKAQQAGQQNILKAATKLSQKASRLAAEGRNEEAAELAAKAAAMLQEYSQSKGQYMRLQLQHAKQAEKHAHKSEAEARDLFESAMQQKEGKMLKLRAQVNPDHEGHLEIISELENLPTLDTVFKRHQLEGLEGLGQIIELQGLAEAGEYQVLVETLGDLSENVEAHVLRLDGSAMGQLLELKDLEKLNGRVYEWTEEMGVAPEVEMRVMRLPSDKTGQGGIWTTEAPHSSKSNSKGMFMLAPQVETIVFPSPDGQERNIEAKVKIMMAPGASMGGDELHTIHGLNGGDTSQIRIMRMDGSDENCFVLKTGETCIQINGGEHEFNLQLPDGCTDMPMGAQGKMIFMMKGDGAGGMADCPDCKNGKACADCEKSAGRQIDVDARYLLAPPGLPGHQAAPRLERRMRVVPKADAKAQDFTIGGDARVKLKWRTPEDNAKFPGKAKVKTSGNRDEVKEMIHQMRAEMKALREELAELRRGMDEDPLVRAEYQRRPL
jgi:hypothetical protein